MPPDGQGLLRLQVHVTLDQVQAFLSVAQWEGVPKRIRLVVLPVSGFRVLPPAGFGVVAVHLAHVVQQGQDGHRFLHVLRQQVGGGGPVGFHAHDGPQAVVHVQGMFQQAARVRSVVPGGGGGLEKVRFPLQPRQEGVRIVPLYPLGPDLQKLRFSVHGLYLHTLKGFFDGFPAHLESHDMEPPQGWI